MGDIVHEGELGEANQAFLVISPQKNTSFRKSREFTLDCIRALSKMPKDSALPDRGFVIDLDNTGQKFIVQFRLADNHAKPDGLSNRGSNPVPGLLFPPTARRCNSNYGQVVPFHVVRVAGSG